MRKDEFLSRLEYLLKDISDVDRNEAIDYYRDYLEEAGPENEASVLREFGSPERIASIIRSDLNGNLEEGGTFTEKGFEDERFREPNYQLAKRMENEGQDKESGWNKNKSFDSVYPEEKQKPRTSGCLKVVLFAILLVIAAPVIFGVGGTAVGILTAIVVTVATLLFLAALLTIAFLVVGVVLVGAGIAAVWNDPVDGVLAIGSGLLIFGLGLLTLVFSVWFYGKLIPRVFRGTGKAIDAVSNWVRRRSG